MNKINADSTDYKDWLIIADNDYKFGNVSLEEFDEFYALIGYHFQQAGEKYLKAYIIKNNLDFKKTHDLPFLLSVCQNYEAEFEDLKEECSFLNRLSVDTRYPAVYDIGATKEDAEQARDAAKKIGDFVKGKIK